MRCPFCHSDEVKVTDSRNVAETNAIRRRRECLACSRRFTTFETIELDIQVLKRDGRYQDFDQDKLISGLLAACRHTKISREQVQEVAAKVTGDILKQQVNVVRATDIGRMVMDELQTRDPVAYIRFACVYRRFTDLDEMRQAMDGFNPHEHMTHETKGEPTCR